jgi:NADPH2:quinone reductase
MTRAIRLSGTGGPNVLTLHTVSVEPPGPGSAVVRHTAIGINFIDTYHRSGLYPVALPSGLGMEAAGVVEEVGDGVTDLHVGDRVAYAGGPLGAYSERRVIAADKLVPLPEAISDDVAAAALLKGMTVEYLVRRVFRVERGMPVLFHAAAGGVGSIACQWLSHLGAEVIGTVGTEEKAERARALRCAHPIVYTEEDFVERVRAITDGRGVPVVYDSIGKATFERSLDCVARRGMLVGFGNASGKPDPFDALLLAQKGSLFLTRPTLMDYVATREELLASAAALFEVIASGAVRIDIEQRWPLAEAADAHRALEARRTVGSSLLVP